MNLVAGGRRVGASQRRLVEQRIGPVWEANHVWLIFVLVALRTGFPTAFAAITSALYVPLTMAKVGIILRGAAFAFRKAADDVSVQRLFGFVFAVSSVLTPFFLGAVAGAVASGRVSAASQQFDPFESWMNPTSFLGGTLAVATCSYVAAVFLSADAARQSRSDLAERDRASGLGAALASIVIALGGIFVIRADASELYEGLTSRGLPLIIAAAVGGCWSLVSLARRTYRWARAAAVAAIVSVVWGWAAGQYPDLLVDELTIADAAGSRATLVAMLVSLVVGSVLFVPPLVALLVIHARGGLDDEEMTDGLP